MAGKMPARMPIKTLKPNATIIELAVTMDANGLITALSLVQRAPTVPRHGD